MEQLGFLKELIYGKFAPAMTLGNEPQRASGKPVEQEDLNLKLRGWDYEPGLVKVREVLRGDGSKVVQLRVELGVLQLELTGRPDGARPYGHPSLLDYHKLQAKLSSSYTISIEDCRALEREIDQYHTRLTTSLVLEKWFEALKDLAFIREALKLIQACREAEYPSLFEGRQTYLNFRFYEIISCVLEQEGVIDEALEHLDRGMRCIGIGSDCDAQYVDIYLQRLLQRREEIIKSLPADHPLKLRAQLDEAVRNEDYVLAAELWNRISETMRPEEPKITELE